MVFGFWAFVLVIALVALTGKTDAVDYMESRNFTEPMFVFVIMVIAASRPILDICGGTVDAGRLLPLQQSPVVYFLCLSLIPILGSFITEPAAMTVAVAFDAARSLFRQRPVGAFQVRHARRVVRQCVDRRHADQFR